MTRPTVVQHCCRLLSGSAAACATFLLSPCAHFLRRVTFFPRRPQSADPPGGPACVHRRRIPAHAALGRDGQQRTQGRLPDDHPLLPGPALRSRSGKPKKKGKKITRKEGKKRSTAEPLLVFAQVAPRWTWRERTSAAWSTARRWTASLWCSATGAWASSRR